MRTPGVCVGAARRDGVCGIHVSSVSVCRRSHSGVSQSDSQ